MGGLFLRWGASFLIGGGGHPIGGASVLLGGGVSTKLVGWGEGFPHAPFPPPPPHTHTHTLWETLLQWLMYEKCFLATHTFYGENVLL